MEVLLEPSVTRNPSENSSGSGKNRGGCGDNDTNYKTDICFPSIKSSKTYYPPSTNEKKGTLSLKKRNDLALTQDKFLDIDDLFRSCRSLTSSLAAVPIRRFSDGNSTL